MIPDIKIIARHGVLSFDQRLAPFAMATARLISKYSNGNSTSCVRYPTELQDFARSLRDSSCQRKARPMTRATGRAVWGGSPLRATDPNHLRGAAFQCWNYFEPPLVRYITDVILKSAATLRGNASIPAPLHWSR
jgi:hypothetical protein